MVEDATEIHDRLYRLLGRYGCNDDNVGWRQLAIRLAIEIGAPEVRVEPTITAKDLKAAENYRLAGLLETATKWEEVSDPIGTTPRRTWLQERAKPVTANAAAVIVERAIRGDRNELRNLELQRLDDLSRELNDAKRQVSKLSAETRALKKKLESATASEKPRAKADSIRRLKVDEGSITPFDVAFALSAEPRMQSRLEAAAAAPAGTATNIGRMIAPGWEKLHQDACTIGDLPTQATQTIVILPEEGEHLVGKI